MQMGKKAPQKDDATAARYTRADVARVLGVSRRTVQRLEGVDLHPEVKNGVHWFDAAEVHALAEARRAALPTTMTDGELAAAVFERFEAGHDISAIVRELKIHPRVVKELYVEFKTDLETHYIEATSAAR